MGFYLIQNDQTFCPRFSVLASAGRPDRSTETWSQSTGRSIDVHRHARQSLLEGRPSREHYSLEMPRSTAPIDRKRALLSVLGSRSTGRSTDGSMVRNLTVGRSTDGSMVRNLTVGRSTGRSTARPTWLPTANFSSPINLGVWGCFKIRFFKWFSPVFLRLFRGFPPLD